MIHHLAFRTRDVARLERFYAEGLGLPVTRRGPRSVWLESGGVILMLEEATPEEPAVPAGTMEIVVFAASAVPPERLAGAGITPEARTASTIYFRDPEGRRLGISAYPLPLP